MSRSYLALDTSTESCSVALLHDGDISFHRFIHTREHAKLLLPMVQELMSTAGATMADIDGVAFGRGPGSFTGLRIAASAAQGLAFARDLPLVGVSTLAAVAQGAKRELGIKYAAVAMDARMGQVYWGCYDSSGLTTKRQGEEQVCNPDAVVAPESTDDAPKKWVGVGTGWEAYNEELETTCEPFVQRNMGPRLPEARDILQIALSSFASGDTLTVDEALPVYLRDKVAKTTKERLAEGGKR